MDSLMSMKKKKIKLINFLLSGKAEKNSLLAFFP